MMRDASFDPHPAAMQLTSAWRANWRLKELPQHERPASIEEAYAVQAAMIERIGEGIAGWKLAGASPRGLRGDLPTGPATGCLIPSRVFRSGAVVRLPAGATMTLEAEVAFRFARTVSPADEELDAASMIAQANVAIEVVCSRFTDRKSVGQPSFIADNVGFHSLVCGDPVNFSNRSLFDEDAGLWRNGERVGNSLDGEDRTRPLMALGFLWSEFGRLGKMIPEGSVVTTGTLSVPVETSRTGHYEARVGNASVGLTLAG